MHLSIVWNKQRPQPKIGRASELSKSQQILESRLGLRFCTTPRIRASLEISNPCAPERPQIHSKGPSRHVYPDPFVPQWRGPARTRDRFPLQASDRDELSTADEHRHPLRLISRAIELHKRAFVNIIISSLRCFRQFTQHSSFSCL